MEEFASGGGAPACGSAAEFRQALRGGYTRRGLAGAGQDAPEDFTVFRLGRAAALGGPDAKGANDIVIEVADCERRHWAPHAVNDVNDSI
jgi:hypothetical protein